MLAFKPNRERASSLAKVSTCFPPLPGFILDAGDISRKITECLKTCLIRQRGEEESGLVHWLAKLENEGSVYHSYLLHKVAEA